jgi:hypothetical protein
VVYVKLDQQDDATTRFCQECRLRKPFDEFHLINKGLNRRHARKVCCYERQKVSRAARPEKYAKARRMAALARKYGLNPDQFAQMMSDQGAECKICKATLTSANIAVDHDHLTGLVRGLLCRLCNSGLGFFKDDPEKLEAAIRYLRDSSLS